MANPSRVLILSSGLVRTDDAKAVDPDAETPRSSVVQLDESLHLVDVLNGPSNREAEALGQLDAIASTRKGLFLSPLLAMVSLALEPIGQCTRPARGVNRAGIAAVVRVAANRLDQGNIEEFTSRLGAAFANHRPQAALATHDQPPAIWGQGGPPVRAAVSR